MYIHVSPAENQTPTHWSLTHHSITAPPPMLLPSSILLPPLSYWGASVLICFYTKCKTNKAKTKLFFEKQLTVTHSDHVRPHISECRIWNLAIEYPIYRHY